MAKNTASPKQLAQEVIELAKAQVRSTLGICQAFARGWNAYLSGEWNNEQIALFLNTIYEGGIGPDPNKTILIEDQEGRYSIKPNATSFFFMKAVGEHLMFHDTEILEACKVSGYSVLAALVRHYEACLGKTNNHTRAKRDTLALLEYGSDLKREMIEAAIAKLKRAQRKPEADNGNEASGGSSERTTYKQLVEAGAKFDTLFLTPSSEVLEVIANSSFETLLELCSFDDVRTESTNIHILANGANLNAVLKLAHTMGETKPHIYGISKRETSSRVVDLSAVEILVSTRQVRLRSNKGDALDLVVNAISEKNANQLHLFSDEENEGWTTVPPESSVP
jgi:hypothetical protein